MIVTKYEYNGDNDRHVIITSHHDGKYITKLMLSVVINTSFTTLYKS